MKHELYEELGIEASIGRPLFIQQFSSTRADRDEELEFFFLIKNIDEFVNIDFNGTSHGPDELAACAYIDVTKEFVLPRFIAK